MTDYWPHLKDDEQRGKTIASILSDDIKDAWVCDLNCGHAPLLKALPVLDFASYYGNDVQHEFINELKALDIPRTKFEVKEDQDVKQEKIDVLVLLGAMGGLLHEPGSSAGSVESMRDSSVFMYLLELHRLAWPKPGGPTDSSGG